MLSKLRLSLRSQWAWMVLAVGLTLTALSSYNLHQQNQTHIRLAVQQALDVTVEATLRRIQLYQYGLRGARGAVLTAGEHDISRALFHRYSLSRNPAVEFPGARGFGFVRRVSLADEPSFLAKARADDWPDFHIHQLTQHTGERYVIQYIEPVERNLAAVGLDLASEPQRAAAALAAMRTGEVRLSGPVTLVQASGQPQQSFLIMLPLYRGSATPATLAERERLAFGWSFAPLVMSEVFADLALDAQYLLLQLVDVTESAPSEPFFSNTEGASAGLYRIEQSQQIFGRTWQFNFAVTPLFIQRLHLASTAEVGFFGGMMSLLFAVVTAAVLAAKQQKQRLQLEQANLAAIVESSADGIIALGLDGCVTSWNRGAQQIFGYSVAQAENKSLPSLIFPAELAENYQQLVSSLAQDKTIVELATTGRRADGTAVDISVSMSPIYANNGSLLGRSVTLRDISQQKHAEAKILQLNASLETQVQQRTADLSAAQQHLHATTEQLILAYEVAELGIWEWLPETNALQWNDKMYALYEQPIALRQQGLAYSHWQMRVHPDDLDSTVTALMNVVAGTGEYNPVFRLLLPSGVTRYVQAAASVQRNEAGAAIRVIGINRDITAEHELEQGLREAKTAAEAASNAKSMFLANMSHEIRTPMNAVLGMLQLIRTTELSQRQDDYVSKAQVAAKSLLDLLNDILDYSKIEAGKLELEIQPFSLDELLRELNRHQ